VIFLDWLKFRNTEFVTTTDIDKKKKDKRKKNTFVPIMFNSFYQRVFFLISSP